MSATMTDYLRIAWPFVDEGLVSAELRQEIDSITNLLPPSAVSAFEIPLDSAEPEADFLACYSIKQLLPTALSLADKHPFWRKMIELHNVWEQAPVGSALHLGLEAMTFEYDVTSGLPTANAVPNMYFTESYPEPCDIEARRAIVASVIDKTSTTQPSAAALANVNRCVRELPSHAAIFAIGDMVHRADRAVRFVVSKLDILEVAAYLNAIGCAIDAAELNTICQRYAHHSHESGVVLNLNVAQEITPKVGIELYVRGEGRWRHAKWAALLDQCVQDGLALPSKRDAINAWGGFSTEQTSAEPWPQNLTIAQTFLNSRQISALSRRVNHIKLVYQPGSLRAKAYLRFEQLWQRRVTPSNTKSKSRVMADV